MTQCWADVGQPSTTLAQHQTNTGSAQSECDSVSFTGVSYQTYRPSASVLHHVTEHLHRCDGISDKDRVHSTRWGYTIFSNTLSVDLSTVARSEFRELCNIIIMGITQSHGANSGSSVTLYGHYTVTWSKFRELCNIIIMGITQSHGANSGSSETLYGHYTVTWSEFRELWNIIIMGITQSHGANSGSSVTLSLWALHSHMERIQGAL